MKDGDATTVVTTTDNSVKSYNAYSVIKTTTMSADDKVHDFCYERSTFNGTESTTNKEANKLSKALTEQMARSVAAHKSKKIDPQQRQDAARFHKLLHELCVCVNNTLGFHFLYDFVRTDAKITAQQMCDCITDTAAYGKLNAQSKSYVSCTACKCVRDFILMVLEDCLVETEMTHFTHIGQSTNGLEQWNLVYNILYSGRNDAASVSHKIICAFGGQGQSKTETLAQIWSNRKALLFRHNHTSAIPAPVTQTTLAELAFLTVYHAARNDSHGHNVLRDICAQKIHEIGVPVPADCGQKDTLYWPTVILQLDRRAPRTVARVHATANETPRTHGTRPAKRPMQPQHQPRAQREIEGAEPTPRAQAYDRDYTSSRQHERGPQTRGWNAHHRRHIGRPTRDHEGDAEMPPNHDKRGSRNGPRGRGGVATTQRPAPAYTYATSALGSGRSISLSELRANQWYRGSPQ